MKVFVSRSVLPSADSVPAGIVDRVTRCHRQPAAFRVWLKEQSLCAEPAPFAARLRRKRDWHDRRAASSCDETATIGCENVILSVGANATSPSGVDLVTSRGTLLNVGGVDPVMIGAKAAAIVWPVRGGGNEFSRNLKLTSSPASA